MRTGGEWWGRVRESLHSCLYRGCWKLLVPREIWPLSPAQSSTSKSVWCPLSAHAYTHTHIHAGIFTDTRAHNTQTLLRACVIEFRWFDPQKKRKDYINTQKPAQRESPSLKVAKWGHVNTHTHEHETEGRNLNRTDTAARLLQTHPHLFPKKSTPYCKTHTEKSFSLSSPSHFLLPCLF